MFQLTVHINPGTRPTASFPVYDTFSYSIILFAVVHVSDRNAGKWLIYFQVTNDWNSGDMGSLLRR